MTLDTSLNLPPANNCQWTSSNFLNWWNCISPASTTLNSWCASPNADESMQDAQGRTTRRSWRTPSILILMQINRIGPQHQAGSDSLLTAKTFFKMKQMYFDDVVDDEMYLGCIYGLNQESSRAWIYSIEKCHFLIRNGIKNNLNSSYH